MHAQREKALKSASTGGRGEKQKEPTDEAHRSGRAQSLDVRRDLSSGIRPVTSKMCSLPVFFLYTDMLYILCRHTRHQRSRRRAERGE